MGSWIQILHQVVNIYIENTLQKSTDECSLNINVLDSQVSFGGGTKSQGQYTPTEMQGVIMYLYIFNTNKSVKIIYRQYVHTEVYLLTKSIGLMLLNINIENNWSD